MRLLSTLPLLLALLLALPASAQVELGLKAGLNTANFVGDDAVDSEARLGFVGGLTGRVAATPSVGLEVGALYSQKGEVYYDADDDYELSTQIDYLEIPASLRFRLPTGPLLDVGLSLGGYLGIPLSAEVEADTFAPGDVLRDIAAADVDPNTDYGLQVGLDLGSGPFFVDASFRQGLADVTDFDPVFGSNLDRQNQVVSLMAGVRFGGGGPRY